LAAVGAVLCDHSVSEFLFERNLGNGADVRLRQNGGTCLDENAPFCTLAAMGDVEIILGIYAAGALAAGRWSYMERMPVVSALGAGLLPLFQMTLLPPLTFLFAR
jgi:hypothetical protein